MRLKFPAVIQKDQQLFHLSADIMDRTNLTMGMTSKVKPYKFGFGPFAPEIYQAPFPYMYHKPAGMTDEDYIDQVIQEFKDFFIATVAPEMVACVVMEPVQGEGGFIVPPKKFVQAVSEFL